MSLQPLNTLISTFVASTCPQYSAVAELCLKNMTLGDLSAMDINYLLFLIPRYCNASVQNDMNALAKTYLYPYLRTAPYYVQLDEQFTGGANAQPIYCNGCHSPSY